MIKTKMDKIRYFIAIQWLLIGMIWTGNSLFDMINYIVDIATDPFESFVFGMFVIHAINLSFGLINLFAGYRFITEKCLGFLLGSINSVATSILTLLFIILVSYESGLLRWLLILLIFILSTTNVFLLWKNRVELRS